MRPRLHIAAAAFVTSLVVSVPAFAASGDLDPTFAGDGEVTVDFGASEGANDAALQSDGKLVVVGGQNPSGAADLVVARLNADGSLDRSFDQDGKATISFGDNVSFSGLAVAVQADGKIVVAGSAAFGDTAAPGGIDFGVVRLNADGSIDPSFDGDGRVAVGFDDADRPFAYDQLEDMALEPDGRIVLVGAAHDNESFGVVRLNSDGSLDSSFDGDGKATIDWGENNFNEFANAVAVEPDGTLVVAGYFNRNLHYTVGVARLSDTGELDPTFDADGQATIDFPGKKDIASNIAVQADGKVVVAGLTKPLHETSDFALARLNADGSPDLSFSEDGTQTIDFDTSASASSVAIQADGKIVAGGGDSHDFTLARLAADGSLDDSFANGGTESIDFGVGSGASTALIQPDGKIVAAGGAGGDFAVARVLGVPLSAACRTAKSRLTEAERALRKARHSGDSGRIKKAKREVKKAERGVQDAC